MAVRFTDDKIQAARTEYAELALEIAEVEGYLSLLRRRRKALAFFIVPRYRGETS